MINVVGYTQLKGITCPELGGERRLASWQLPAAPFFKICVKAG